MVQGFTNPVGMLDACLCLGCSCLGGGLGPRSVCVVLCLCEL